MGADDVMPMWGGEGAAGPRDGGGLWRSPLQVVRGQPPSKSNSYRIVTVAGHASLATTRAAREYEGRFYMQCGLRGRGISGRFTLVADFYFSSDRPDLDNALKIVLDCLQGCGAIRNDRQCAEIRARKLIDKADPRVEFLIEEAPF